MRKMLQGVVGLAMAIGSSSALAQLSLYRDLGMSRFGEVIVAAEKSIAESPERAAGALPPLCYAYYKVRRYDKIAMCIAALDARIKAGMHIHSDGIIMASDLTPFPGLLRASVHLDFGEYEHARAAGEAALALVKDEAWGGGMMAPIRYRMEILPILGTAAANLGDPAGAESYARTLREIPLGFTGAAMASFQDAALGRIYMALKQCDKVLEYSMKGEQGGFVRSLGDLLMGAESDSLKTQFDLSQSFQSGKCLAETGKHKEAQAALDYVIRHPRASVNGDVYWLALFERGRLAEMQGDSPGAIEFYRRAIEVIERQRSSISSEASKIGFAGDKQAAYGRIVSLLVAGNRAAEAFEYVERSKARALVDLLARKQEFASPAVDPAKLRSIVAQFDAADLAARSQGIDQAVAQPLAVRGLEVARATIQSTAPELASLLTVSSVTPEALKALLPADEALVEYYYQGNELFAFLLAGQQLGAFKLDATALAEDVQSFRRRIQQPLSGEWQAASRALHERLWAPIAASIGSRKVLVVPHGALHYLPFAALQDSNGSFVLDRHALRTLPSASALKYLRPARAAGGTMLVLGNPDLGDPKMDLKFAEGEARAVATLFPGARLLVREDASESNVKKAGNAFSRLHFASHGTFHAERPLESGLHLARDSDNDGVLTVGELYSMDVDADLVTLSACETGLGKVANGDDVVGLTRGFLFAGSRSVVASLWSVDDRATATLMKAFYENLGAKPKRESLREAQLKTRGEFPHPFFWAAFQITGRGE